MAPIIRKFSRLFELSDEEVGILQSLANEYEEVGPNTVMVSAGEPFAHSYLLQSGWSMVYKLLPDGSQQILSFAVPGDFLGLYGVVMNRAEHSIQTITPSRVCHIKGDQIMELFQNYPRLALTICWFGARDQILLREQIVRIGRQTAYNRTGHLFLELYDRLCSVGLAENDSFSFPVTQEMLADALGLTPVHVNRTLKKLRNNGLVEITDQCLIIHDRKRLVDETCFDSAYLEDLVIPEDIANQPTISR